MEFADDGPACTTIRQHKFLLYAAHSGFGNQELSLRRALLVAYVLNRTLVVPPVLRQSDLAFGPPEQRCRNASWQGYVQARAEQLYLGKVAAATDASQSATYESLLHAGVVERGSVQRAQLLRAGVHSLAAAAAD